MIVKCISKSGPFVEGNLYDVALIYEFPDRIMVREPNSAWPKPDNWMFGWHISNIFERPKKPLEIVKCGYRHLEYECYGTTVKLEDILNVDIHDVSEKVRDEHASVSRYCRAGIIPIENTIVDNKLQSFAIVSVEIWDLCRMQSFTLAHQVLDSLLCAIGQDPQLHEYRHLEYEIWTSYDTDYAGY